MRFIINFISSLLWNQSLQNLEKGTTSTFQTYKIKKNSSGYLLTIFEILSSKVLNRISEKVNGELKKLTIPQWQFPVAYDKYLEISSHELRQTYESPKENDEFTETIKSNFGVDFEEQKEGLAKVITFTKKFFDQLPPAITQDNVNTIIPLWQEAATNEKLKLRAELCGTKIVQEKIELTKTDRQFLGLDGKESLKDLTQLDCSRYALMKIRAVQAIAWIRFSGTPADFYDKEPMKYFNKWGYETIDVAAVRSGDGVVYFNKNNEKGFFITHMGIMRNTGFVESKMGISETAISHREYSLS